MLKKCKAIAQRIQTVWLMCTKYSDIPKRKNKVRTRRNLLTMGSSTYIYIFMKDMGWSLIKRSSTWAQENGRNEDSYPASWTMKSPRICTIQRCYQHGNNSKRYPSVIASQTSKQECCNGGAFEEIENKFRKREKTHISLHTGYKENAYTNFYIGISPQMWTKNSEITGTTDSSRQKLSQNAVQRT